MFITLRWSEKDLREQISLSLPYREKEKNNMSCLPRRKRIQQTISIKRIVI